MLLGYFGETLEAEDCGNCDVCLDPPELYDGTVDAQKALSAVYRIGERFGVGHVIDVLRGADDRGDPQVGPRQLRVYGIGADSPRTTGRAILRQLVHRGYLRQDIAEYSALKLTETARGGAARRGERAARPPAQRRRPRSRRSARSRAARAGAGRPSTRSCSSACASCAASSPPSRACRRTSSSATRRSADMAAARPSSHEEFLEVHGVGEAKAARYGEDFLAEIAAHGGQAPGEECAAG